MTDLEVLNIIKTWRIPFKLGYSSPYGADCAGFIELYYGLIGLKLDLSDIKRQRRLPLSYFEEILTIKGFVKDGEGELGLLPLSSENHLGIILIDRFIHQSLGGTQIVELPSDTIRYTLITD